ncbi:MAG: hypothetical protein OXU20_05145 [Myxococcales bacterium]|nr:hypothetical protein [Myxococcales bacterium]MDD9969074.1 hypothetical protein [Myxococcales bacterium]
MSRPLDIAAEVDACLARFDLDPLLATEGEAAESVRVIVALVWHKTGSRLALEATRQGLISRLAWRGIPPCDGERLIAAAIEDERAAWKRRRNRAVG